MSVMLAFTHRNHVHRCSFVVAISIALLLLKSCMHDVDKKSQISSAESCQQSRYVFSKVSCVIMHNMQENTIIVTTVNSGMLDFAHNFIFFLRRAGVRHFVVVAEDAQSFQDLLKYYPNHAMRFPILLPDGNSHEYKTPGYVAIVSRRPSLLLSLVADGLEVLYSDIDTVWKPGVLDGLFNNCNDFDILAQYDQASYCTGFMYLCPSKTTYHFLGLWSESLRRNPGINQAFFNSLAKCAHLKVHGLDRYRYQSGREYFKMGRNKSSAVMIHNNWIVGAQRKKDRFIGDNLWRPEPSF